MNTDNKLPLWALSLGLSLLAYALAAAELSREKRDVLQLGFMLECSTNRSMWDYDGYGCYCGIGGSGTPLDGTDRCCQTHDNCYAKMHKEKVCSLYIHEYTAFYKYKPCSLCSPLSSYSGWIYKLLAASPRCRYRLCQCDSALARCVRKALPTFNPKYKNYNKKTCTHLKKWTDILTMSDDQWTNQQQTMKAHRLTYRGRH